MTFIHQCCNGWYCNYMSFIMFKVVILQDGTFYCLEIITIFQFDVNISSVDTGSKRNGHGQSITNALFALCCYRVTHAHARAKVCIGNTIWSTCFQKGTNYRVRSRIPAGRDNSNCTGCFCFFIQFTVQVPDLCMDIKTVYGIDSFCQIFLCVFLNRTGWQTQQCNLWFYRQFINVVNNTDSVQFFWLLTACIVTHYADQFKIFGCFHCLQSIMTDVAIANDRCFYFFHTKQSLLFFITNG